MTRILPIAGIVAALLSQAHAQPKCLSERFLNHLSRLPLGVARRLNPLNLL